MVALVEQLLGWKGQHIRIEFVDGEIVDVKLLKVDPEEHQDIVFDVVAVRHSIGEMYSPDRVYIAPLASIKRVERLDNE